MSDTLASGPACIVPVTDVARFYRHGWHSWCATGWLDPDRPPTPIADRVDRMGHADPSHADDRDHGGSGMAAVEHGDGTVTLLGALAPGAWVHLRDGALVGAYEDGAGPWWSASGPEAEVFRRYAGALGEHLGRRGGEPVRLWSSWYSYYEDVTEGHVREALAGLDGIDLDVVQVDDGWQQAVGDWVGNDDFPSGMADLAGRIGATGRRAGLWLAPFIAMPGSALATERPELLLRGEAGDPVVAGENWGGPYFALDVTRPATLDHLAGIIDGYRRAGFGFFKLDFVYAAALPGRHHRPMAREAAYRRAVEQLRAAAGEDAYLLACGAPIIPSIGVFDGIRVGPDVAGDWDDGTWNSAHRSMAVSAQRMWLRPAIDTDPDVVYFRSRQARLTEATKRRLQDLAHVAGFLGTSDPPGWLNAAERTRMADFFSARPEVRPAGRCRWDLDGRTVDFTPALSESAGEPEWSVAR